MHDRHYVQFLALVILLLFFPVFSPASAASGKSIGERFSGETMDYDIGFWLFNPFGIGRAILQNAGNGEYFFSHEAEAQGFIGVITGYRKEIHRSLMAATADGKKFIPLTYEQETVVGDWFRKRKTVYDYASRKMILTTEISGEQPSHTEMEMPKGKLYDNPVTAFYNFRFGAYGNVEPGREIYVPLSPKPRDLIHLVVATAEEAERRRLAEPDKKGKDIFLTVRLDKHIIGSREVQVWLNKDLVPVSGVIKGIRLLGDITGKLKHFGFSSPE